MLIHKIIYLGVDFRRHVFVIDILRKVDRKLR